MIVFLIALKSKQVSKNWDYTCKLLERTLNSIYYQTNQNFKVVIVCHEKPKLSLSYTNLIFHEVDFLPPQINHQEIVLDRDIKEKSYQEMVLDRDIKELLGRQIAKDLKSDWIMGIDSDDCIHKNIADFILSTQQSAKSIIPDGFFADKGYIYYEKSRKIVPKLGLYNCCGSTVVMKAGLYDVPNSSQYSDLIKFYKSGKFFTHGLLVNHWKHKGKVLKPFPFRSCIYVRPDYEQGLDTLRNVLFTPAPSRYRKLKRIVSPLKRKVEKVFRSQNITQNIKDEFGFYTINHDFPEKR